MTNTIAVYKILLAFSLFFCPKRLAAKALTAILLDKNKAKAINLGWVVRPTAATAYVPSVLTIIVSIIPAKATKKLSSTAGQAIRIASKISSFESELRNLHIIAL